MENGNPRSQYVELLRILHILVIVLSNEYNVLGAMSSKYHFYILL